MLRGASKTKGSCHPVKFESLKRWEGVVVLNLLRPK